jgi:hypothetical protein
VIPTPKSVPFNIAIGSDGAVWFTEKAGGKIGRLQMQAAPVAAAAKTTFSSKIYKLPMSVSFGPEWHILDDYPDLVTVEKRHEGWQLGFNIVNNAKLADPVDGHLVPFPADFVSWIKSDPNLVAGEPTEVMVGGSKGIQIDFRSTLTTKNNFLYLKSGIIWNIDRTAFGRFILLNDVNGQRVFIWLVLTVDADQFTLAAGQAQAILDSIVFTK